MTDIRSIDKKLLKEAREETHKAIQFIAMVPRCLLPPDATDTSASLLWDNERNMFTSRDVNGLKAGFNFVSQQIELYEGDRRASSITTAGRSANAVFEALKNALKELGHLGDQLKTDLPYQLPDSVIQRGEPFVKQDAVALQVLTDLYGLTRHVLVDVFDALPEASPVVCWPHHFDLATLITVEAHDDPEEAKSIGFGFSPGDEGYDEPYFYLTPWPYPQVDDLYDLSPPAVWNTQGWVGGVLKAADLTPGDEKNIISAYFKTGLEKLKLLL